MIRTGLTKDNPLYDHLHARELDSFDVRYAVCGNIFAAGSSATSRSTPPGGSGPCTRTHHVCSGVSSGGSSVWWSIGIRFPLREAYMRSGVHLLLGITRNALCLHGYCVHYRATTSR